MLYEEICHKFSAKCTIISPILAERIRVENFVLASFPKTHSVLSVDYHWESPGASHPQNWNHRRMGTSFTFSRIVKIKSTHRGLIYVQAGMRNYKLSLHGLIAKE